jgi:hypothetical protein
MKSKVRMAMDEILVNRHPEGDLVSLDVQSPNQFSTMDGPWVLVGVSVPLTEEERLVSEKGDTRLVSYAIWKETGAIYNFDGFAVEDDPFWEPKPEPGPMVG